MAGTMTKVHVPVAEAVESIGRTARLWRLGGLSPWRLALRTFQGYRENRLWAFSVAFAYYSMLALFPLLILIIAAFARLPLSGVLENSLDAAYRALPEDAYDLLEKQVRDIQDRSTLGLILAAVGVLAMAGSQVFLTIIDGLNQTYGVKETRRLWEVYGMAFLLTVAASLLFMLALILMIIGPRLSQYLAARQVGMPFLETLLSGGVRWGVVCACLWVYTSVVYWLVPNIKLPWYWLSPGSVFAVIGWVVISQGFRFYVENFANYNKTYGALGGVIVLMVWLDLTGVVLLVGGQINGVIHQAEEAAAPAK